MPNVARKFADQVGNLVAEKQARVLDKQVGKYVNRNGVNFLVLKVDHKNGMVHVSDAKTPLKQITKMKLKSFLSRVVTPVEDE